jgi:hypothetical protein
MNGTSKDDDFGNGFYGDRKDYEYPSFGGTILATCDNLKVDKPEDGGNHFVACEYAVADVLDTTPYPELGDGPTEVIEGDGLQFYQQLPYHKKPVEDYNWRERRDMRRAMDLIGALTHLDPEMLPPGALVDFATNRHDIVEGALFKVTINVNEGDNGKYKTCGFDPVRQPDTDGETGERVQYIDDEAKIKAALGLA